MAEISETKEFRLVPDVKLQKFFHALLIVIFLANSILAWTRDPRPTGGLFLCVTYAFLALCYMFTMTMTIKTLMPHQQKRLTLSPDGITYSNHGQIEWQIAWSDLKSVELNKLIDGINGDTEDLIFTTTVGEVHSIPTRSSNLRTMPKKKELLAALESAGFKAELSEIDSYQVRAR